MTEPWPQRSAYLGPNIVENWDVDTLRRWADQAAAVGVTAVVTKLDVITPARRRAVELAGLRVLGSFSCYSDHRHPGALPGGVAPVGRDGRPLARIEWYTGLVPGSAEFDEALCAQLATQLEQAEVDWVVLDFLRWPGHWELESRNGGHPRASSFDSMTLHRFAEALGRDAVSAEDVDVAGTRWERFRARTITDRAGALSAVVHGCGARAGMFLVPLSHTDRRRDYGQDVVSLAASIDLFVLMTYQQMLGLSEQRVLELGDEVRRMTGRPAVAMLQTTADAEYMGGWDAGPSITAAEVAERDAGLQRAVRAGRLAGVSLFPGHAPMPSAG